MAVTQVGTPAAAVSQTGSNTPSITPVFGTGQADTAGDLLVILVTNFGATTNGVPPTPAGWTAGPSVQASSFDGAFTFWKVAAGADTLPAITVTNTGTATNSRLTAKLFELAGADPVTPIGASGTATGTTALSLTVTTTGNVPAAGCYALAVICRNTSTATAGTYTAGSGFTSAENDFASVLKMQSSYDQDASPAPGSALSDAAAWTGGTNQDSAGVLVVFQPAAAGGGGPVPAYAAPGQAWLRRFRHRQIAQQRAAGPVTQTATAALAAASTVTTAVTQAVTAAPRGASAVTAILPGTYSAGNYGAGRYGAADAAPSPPGAAQPGRTWLRRFRHRQPSLPAAVTGPVPGTAALTAASAVTAATAQAAVASPAAASQVSASGVITGTASLTAASAVTAAVTQAAAASLAGAGSLAGAVTEAVTSAVTGAGAVTANITQDAGTATSLAGAGAVSASALVTAPPVPAYAAPGQAWLRRFRHPRQPVPGQPARAGYDGAVMADSPAAYWNDATGADLTGHGHTLTLVNSPTSATMADGGAAYLFDGSTQYCDAGDDDAFSPVTAGRFTIEAWIRPDTLQFLNEEGTGYVYWAGKNQYNPAEWACRMYSLTNSESRPNRISGYAFNSAGGSGIGSFFQDTVTAGEWIHYVLVINTADAGGLFPDGYTKVYKNGVQRDQDDLTGITLANTAAPLRIGSVTLASYFQGAVGRIAIYPAELSAARVLAHFQAMPATAVLAGAGAVSADASVTGAGNTAAVTAAGSVTTAVTQAATAAAQGAGAVAAAAAQAVTGTAAAAGQVAAAAAQGATTAVTAAGSVTAAAAQAVTAVPQGAGSVTGAAVQIATASLAGAGTVTAAASSSGAAGAAITAAGAVTARTAQSATSAAAAAGQVAAAAAQAATSTAAGAGSVNASGVITGTASLIAAAAVTARTAQAAPVTAAAAGTLAALAAQQANTALAAAAALAAAGSVQVAFTVGTLTAADAPGGVLAAAAGPPVALTAADAPGGVLTAAVGPVT